MRKDAAIGIIFNEDRSQVLLTKRKDVPVWVLPGGGIEDGENSEDAILREVYEETGLKVKIIRKSAEYTPINKLARFTEIFECSPTEGQLQQGPETEAIQFFELNNLPKNFFFLHEEWLQDCLKNPSTLIRKPLTQITYLNLAKYFLQHPFWVLRFLFTLLKN